MDYGLFEIWDADLAAIELLKDFIPEKVSPAQIRCALTAVLRRCDEGGMFDKDGWLRPGVYGYQPSLGEDYINVGSLYLCSAVFLPLGLSADDPFWADADEMWTQKKIWSGEDLPCDRALY